MLIKRNSYSTQLYIKKNNKLFGINSKIRSSKMTFRINQKSLKTRQGSVKSHQSGNNKDGAQWSCVGARMERKRCYELTTCLSHARFKNLYKEVENI